MSKLMARRQKDYVFAAALLQAGLVDPQVLLGRLELLNAVHAVNRDAATVWLRRRQERNQER